MALTLGGDDNPHDNLTTLTPHSTSINAALHTSIDAIIDEDHHICIHAEPSSSTLETALSLKPLDTRTKKADNIILAVEHNIHAASGNLVFSFLILYHYLPNRDLVVDLPSVGINSFWDTACNLATPP
jgi:hypothetical protein